MHGTAPTKYWESKSLGQRRPRTMCSDEQRALARERSRARRAAADAADADTARARSSARWALRVVSGRAAERDSRQRARAYRHALATISAAPLYKHNTEKLAHFAAAHKETQPRDGARVAASLLSGGTTGLLWRNVTAATTTISSICACSLARRARATATSAFDGATLPPPEASVVRYRSRK